MQRLSTNDVPPRERLSFLHDFVARHVAGLRFSPADGDNFAFDLSAYFLDSDIAIGSARYSTVLGERTRELIADGRQNYMLTIHDTDYEVTIEGKQTINVAAGDITIVNEGTRSAFTLPGTGVKVIALNEARLAALAPSVRMQAIHHIPLGRPGAALLAGYADLLRATAPASEAACRLASNHLYDLTALALQGGAAEAAERTRQSLGAARLELVKADMLRHLTDPELSIAGIARRHNVTPRYIQRLFEQTGLTFSEFLRDARLDRALKSLDKTGSGEATISTIAFDTGFSDLSNFNRAFRKRFGATPSEVRAAALRRRQ